MIAPASIRFEQLFDPATGLIEWVFRWKADTWSSPSLDQVKLKTATSSCGFPTLPVYLAAGVDGVTVDAPLYRVDLATGDVSYEHVLRYRGWECQTGCQSAYDVSSDNGTTWVPASRPIKILVCPQLQP